jgi:hypothetical protein
MKKRSLAPTVLDRKLVSEPFNGALQRARRILSGPTYAMLTFSGT